MSLLVGVQWRHVDIALNELLCQAAKKPTSACILDTVVFA
jgi:hypothetical protein